MKILIEVNNVFEKKIQVIEAEYNDKTTIRQLLDENVRETPMLLSNKVISAEGEVDYYYHNEVLYWDVNVYDMLVVDFVNKFQQFKYKIPVNVNFGGIGATSPGIIEFATELYKIVNKFINENPLLIMTLGVTANYCKKKIKEWIDKKSNCKRFSSFKDSLYAKEKWKLKDVEKALEVDKNQAIIIMVAMGYTYNQKTEKFVIKKVNETL